MAASYPIGPAQATQPTANLTMPFLMLSAAIRLRRHEKATRIHRDQPYIQGDIMQVARWGNSLAVRLPAAIVEALGLKEGDNIAIHVVGDRAFELERTPTSQELLARLRKYRGRLPAGFTFD